MIKKTNSTNDYETYKAIQIGRSGKKWTCNTFWKDFHLFETVMIEINKLYGPPESICCMGIRSGNEYKGFREELVGFKDTKVYGVDIAPQVREVGPNCFCFDFSQLPVEWAKKFTWVYSNSLDHSFDVQKTLKEWHRVCKDYLILTMSACGRVTDADLYDFELSDIDTLFDKNLFEVERVWDFSKQYAVFTVLLKIK